MGGKNPVNHFPSCANLWQRRTHMKHKFVNFIALFGTG
ncbi:hypothetical protein PLUTE_a3240 [Pseudoalteromonas luteoviolacea DSM 6061]|nr:hypothetical protein [Pseudoalteromonas luteoviolacea DSM 6061]